MNFFEQQDRARRATRLLIGLFTTAVMFICICVYFAVMLTINTTSLRVPVFGNRACQPIPTQVRSTANPHQLNISDSIPLIPNIDRQTDPVKSGFGGFSRSGSAFRSSDRFSNSYDRSIDRRSSEQINPVNCRSQMVWDDFVIFFWTLISTSTIIGVVSWGKIKQLQAGGAVIAAELGGVRVLPETATPAERQLLNIVEEMAIAATMPVPPVYILYDEVGINAFAAGFTVDDAVIGVTRECLEHLTRDELQGIIAHEFSHILNGDMAMNIRLTGVLHGILFLNLTGRILTAAGASGDNPIGRFGFMLRIIGFSGFLSGRMIQAAISRQRELLADASAVQFTRNSEGIAGALSKTIKLTSYLSSPYAETSSHIFFSPAIKPSFFEGLFATHPSLAQRMQIVKNVGRKLGTQIIINGETVPNFKQISRIEIGSDVDVNPTTDSSASVGGYSALAYVYTLLLDSNQTHQSAQLDYLAQREETSVLEQIETLHSEIENLPPTKRLEMLDRQLATLLDTEHTPRLLKCAYGMIELLPAEDWHNALVYLILHHRLAPSINRAEIYHSTEDVWAEIINILGTLTRSLSDRPQDINYAFESALFRLPSSLSNGVKLPPEITWREFQTDLSKISAAAPKVKQVLMSACLEVLTNQRQIPTTGVDLMRSISILLDCPIPPLLERLSTVQLTHSSLN